MTTQRIYDIIGIGIGPFNLGLAALAEAVPSLGCLFFDAQPSFNWHPGLLLQEARLQVPFYADLVTLADPCSPYSYLAYLKAKQRLFRFTIHEQYFPTRKEFNDYCQWVAGQLCTLHFGYRCEAVHFDAAAEIYQLYLRETSSQQICVFNAKHIVMGVGTEPQVPSFAAHLNHPFVLHSGKFLYHKQALLTSNHITIVGSGQSAAEILYDLLHHFPGQPKQLSWFTRSARFFPMDYSKLALEMTSPDYIDYFYQLPACKKQAVLKSQDHLYKGINHSLINAIYDRLYLLGLEKLDPDIQLCSNSELKGITIHPNGKIKMSFHHSETDQEFSHETDALILATGYTAHIPSFLEPVKELIRWTADHRYDVRRNYSIDKKGHTLFVQNAELHTHGFNAADLGMGPYRNAVILNTILGQEYFSMETRIAFQQFGVPQNHS